MAVKQKTYLDALNEKEATSRHYSDYGRIICNYIQPEVHHSKIVVKWPVDNLSHYPLEVKVLIPDTGTPKTGKSAVIGTSLKDIIHEGNKSFYVASFLQFIAHEIARKIEAEKNDSDVFWVNHAVNNTTARVITGELSDAAYLPEKTVSPLDELIIKADGLKNLPLDWDEDGALPIDETTVEYASWFLRHYYNYTLKHFGTKIQLPEINPCPDGSIDLEWHTPFAQLLINIRKDKEGVYTAYYYGDRHNNKMQVKGSTPLSEFSEHLAVWMKYLA